MDTIYIAVGTKQAITAQANAVARAGLTVLSRWLDALRERREREAVRARLNDLSDHELLDIGIGRAEVDYVASHRASDPRNVVRAGSI
jgi:uncharacterized protein YjiS (DUF1127 family)